jgi:hypothetical protein
VSFIDQNVPFIDQNVPFIDQNVPFIDQSWFDIPERLGFRHKQLVKRKDPLELNPRIWKRIEMPVRCEDYVISWLGLIKDEILLMEM